MSQICIYNYDNLAHSNANKTETILKFIICEKSNRAIYRNFPKAFSKLFTNNIFLVNKNVIPIDFYESASQVNEHRSILVSQNKY